MENRERYLIWDWNGTLLDDVETCVDVMNGMLERRGLAPLKSVECYRGIFTFPVREYYKKAGLNPACESFEKLALEYISEYNRRALSCGLVPYAREILREAEAMGFRQLLVSATESETLEEQAEQYGLTGCFEAVLGAENFLGEGKAGVARRYLEERNVAPNQAIFVGDTVHDCEVAQTVGSPCVLTASGHQDRPRLEAMGVPVLGGLEELPAYLKGLRLRPLRAEDASAVFAMTSDPRVARYMRFDTHESLGEAQELIAAYGKRGGLAFLAETLDGSPIGVAALKREGTESEEADLSVFSRPEYWGKGYNGIILRELLRRGERAGIRSVRGYVVSENRGSCRLLENCGFTVERQLQFDDLSGGLFVFCRRLG